MTGSSGGWDNLAFDGHGNLYDLSGEFSIETYGSPPPVEWVAVLDLPPPVFGRRLCVMTPSGPHYDQRAASEVYEESGGFWINLVGDAQWWAWNDLPADRRPPRIPRAVPWRTQHVWAEVRQVPVPDSQYRRYHHGDV